MDVEIVPAIVAKYALSDDFPIADDYRNNTK